MIGARIFFDSANGNVLYVDGESDGGVEPRPKIISIDFVDLEYGELNLITHKIIGMDIETRKPILEEREKDPIQQHVQELEDQLLLQADSEFGGIL